MDCLQLKVFTQFMPRLGVIFSFDLFVSARLKLMFYWPVGPIKTKTIGQLFQVLDTKCFKKISKRWRHWKIESFFVNVSLPLRASSIQIYETPWQWQKSDKIDSRCLHTYWMRRENTKDLNPLFALPGIIFLFTGLECLKRGTNY